MAGARGSATTETPPPEVQVVVLAAEIRELGGIGTALRAFTGVLSDVVGPARCEVISVWDSGATQRPVHVPVSHEGRLRTGSPVVPLGVRARYAIIALRAMYRRRTGLVIVVGHVHLIPIAYLASRLLRRPYVAWVYGTEVWQRLPRHIGFALRRADRILSISDFTRASAIDLQGLDPDRIRVVPLGLWSGTPPPSGVRRQDTVLTVARLNRQQSYKGVVLLLQVWQRVLRRRPSAELIVVGEGDDRARLERLADCLGIGTRVTFAGAVSDEELSELYATATLFALPGRAAVGPRAEGEGFGLVFAEAAWAGLPVLAGSGGGAPEALDPGTNGVVVDVDRPDGVAAAIVELLDDVDLRSRLGEAGPAFVRSKLAYEDFKAAIAAELRSVA